MGDSTFSDHHPVSFQINLSSNVPGGSSWKASGTIFQEAKEPIRAIWEASLSKLPSFTKLRRIVKYHKQICLAQAAENRLEDTRLRQYLEFWQTTLHFDLANGTSKEWTKKLRNKIQSLAEKKEERRQIRSRTSWMQSGDRMNKYFFSSVKERPASGLITELFDEDNTTISSSADLARVCNSLYSNLYVWPVMDEHNTSTRKRC